MKRAREEDHGAPTASRSRRRRNPTPAPPPADPSPTVRAYDPAAMDPAAVAAVDPNAAAPAGADWRTQLQPEARSRIVNKIMETLKKHLPVPEPEALSELQRIAVRFEEKIYTAATNQSDYLRKISLKMLSMESQTKTQQNPGNAQVIPNQNPPGPGDALDEHVNTLLSLGTNRRHETPSATNPFPVISLVDTPEVKFFKAPPEPVREVPKKPKFTCPICMNELTEAASTVCGHIFCQKCIKAAIQAQKKCPTCRRTLNKNQYHRVYLPTTE